jgi:solute carrier family 44 protein 1 (choline transporter-like protein)
LNSVGDFLLFLAKVCVVTATALIGIELINEKSHLLHFYWAPIITAALFAYFVSHCFLSVYEVFNSVYFINFYKSFLQIVNL